MAKIEAKKLSAGVVPVRNSGGDFLFLLLRAYNYWDFPKGEVAPLEDPLAAALRECKEETGIDELGFPWGRIFKETEVYAQGKVARYYLAETKQSQVVLGVDPVLRRPEHHEFRWLSCEAARPLLVPRVREILDWAYYTIRNASVPSSGGV